MAHGWWMRMTYLADVFHYAFWQWDVNQMQPDASVQQSAGKATGNVCEMVPLHCDMASVLRDRGCGWNHGASLPPCLVCDTVQVYDVSMTWLKASQCCLVCIHFPMSLTTCCFSNNVVYFVQFELSHLLCLANEHPVCVLLSLWKCH